MDTYELTEELKQALQKANNLDEMVIAFKNEGIEITKEQLVEIGSSFTDDVLDENDLDSVAGGLSFLEKCRAWAYAFGYRHGIYIARLVKRYI